MTVRSGGASFLSSPATVELALQIDPNNIWVRSKAIDERLKTVRLGDDAAALAAFSRDTLKRSPYDPIALRTVGIIMASNDDDAAAGRLLSIAGRLSLRDYLTHAWLLNYRLQNGAFDAAVREADILIRQRPENADIVVPALVAISDDERAIEPLAALLKRAPPWRSFFITEVGETGKNPGMVFRLLNRLREVGSRPTTDEMFTYFVIAGQKVPPRQLYAQWLSMLPPAVAANARGPLRDGDFAGIDAPAPFSWRLYPKDGVYAEREKPGPADMGSALYASFAGNQDTLFANQALVLDPGRYRLTWRAFADTATDERTFRWEIACLSKGHHNIIGQVPIATSADTLKSGAAQFDVPIDCDEQQLALLGANVGGGFQPPSVHLDRVTLVKVR